MKRLDFAEYIRRAELINECDRKHLNSWAIATLSKGDYLGVQILDLQDFGDEPLPAIVRRIVRPVLLRHLKIRGVDEQNNAVEYVFDTESLEVAHDRFEAGREGAPRTQEQRDLRTSELGQIMASSQNR